MKHEVFPEIIPDQPESVSLGEGQRIVLTDVKVSSGKMTIGSAQAWNPGTGARENLNVKFLDAVEAEIRDTGLNPFTFVDRCVSEVSAYLMRIGAHLDKPPRLVPVPNCEK